MEEFYTPDFERLALGDRGRLVEYRKWWIAPLVAGGVVALVGLGFLIAGYAPFRMLDGVVLLCVAVVVASLAGFPYEEERKRRERIDSVDRVGDEWASLRYFAYPTHIDEERLMKLYARLYGGEAREARR